MSCQKLSRQSLYMVINGSRGLFPLSRMDVSRLFYPKREEAQAAQVKAKEENNGSIILPAMGRLPKPSVCATNHSTRHFMLFLMRSDSWARTESSAPMQRATRASTTLR